MNFSSEDNRECLTALLTLVVGVIIVFWLIDPKKSKKSAEGFASEEEAAPAVASATPVTVSTPTGNADGPTEAPVTHGGVSDYKYFDPSTGTLMSGPGWVDPIMGDVQPIESDVPPNYYFLNDGAEGTQTVHHNLCSRSCCSAQYPLPFAEKTDPYVEANRDQFVPSNLMCNNVFQDSGCLCLRKDQQSHLSHHGNNR